MSTSREFEIHVGVTGRTSKVLLDGEPVPGVYRVVIDCAVERATTLEIHARKLGGDPYVIKGRMVEDVTTLPENWREQAREVWSRAEITLPNEPCPSYMPDRLMGWKLRDGRFVSVEEVEQGLVS